MAPAFADADSDIPRRQPLLSELRHLAVDACRDLGAPRTLPGASLGVEVQVRLTDLPRAHWAEQVPRWQAKGVTHLSVVTAGTGAALDDHLRLLETAAPALLAGQAAGA